MEHIHIHHLSVWYGTRRRGRCRGGGQQQWTRLSYCTTRLRATKRNRKKKVDNNNNGVSLKNPDLGNNNDYLLPNFNRAGPHPTKQTLVFIDQRAWYHPPPAGPSASSLFLPAKNVLVIMPFFRWYNCASCLFCLQFFPDHLPQAATSHTKENNQCSRNVTSRTQHRQ